MRRSEERHACPHDVLPAGNTILMKTRTTSRTVALVAGALILIAAGPTSPSLPVTSAFIAAGGGAGSFSSVRAFTHIVGPDTLQAELAKLRLTFGGHNVDRFVRVLDYAINDGWQRAGQDDVKMPAPTADTGTALALDMVKAGTSGPNSTFRTTTMMDALLTARVHSQVGADIAARYGGDAVANFEGVGNQFFYDLAHSLGNSSVTLPNSPG